MATLKDARTQELLGELDEGVDADAAELWKQEIGCRIDDIEAGTAELEDWEDVRDRLRGAAQRP